jgi:hypothetical protein
MQIAFRRQFSIKRALSALSNVVESSHLQTADRD